jgi:hypothetical protein
LFAKSLQVVIVVSSNNDRAESEGVKQFSGLLSGKRISFFIFPALDALDQRCCVLEV